MDAIRFGLNARALAAPRARSALASAIALALVLAWFALCIGCSKKAAAPPVAETEVTVMTVTRRDTPVDFEFTAQTQSSREVEIRARVDGFLDQRTYTEGQMVKRPRASWPSRRRGSKWRS
jgi:multidrug efflux pump subunit AcrA (membrane-fusion protein)